MERSFDSLSSWWEESQFGSWRQNNFFQHASFKRQQ